MKNINGDDMDNMEILNAFKAAIRNVYLDSEGYFNPTKGRERSMVFRIAHQLANQIEKTSDMFVDIEATRCNGKTKRTVNNTIVIPDLIVHHRNGHGHFVAEFKCNKNDKRKAYDCAKLELFTLKKIKSSNLNQACPTYDFGAYVYLANSLDKVEITLFKDGGKQELIRGL